MSNMSYVKMENTYFDLLDCYNSIIESGSIQDLDLSCSEKKYLSSLYRLCGRFQCAVDDMMEDQEDITYEKVC